MKWVIKYKKQKVWEDKEEKENNTIKRTEYFKNQFRDQPTEELNQKLIQETLTNKAKKAIEEL